MKNLFNWVVSLYKQYDYDFIQQIESGINLSDYIQTNINLKPRGSRLFGHCPLHVDKTPSFAVMPQQNKFRCFSCGKSGGIISYLMSYEGLSFTEAVNKACLLSGNDINQMCQSNVVNYLKKIRNSISKDKRPQKIHTIIPESELDKYSKQPIQEWLNEGIRQEVLDEFEIRFDRHSNRIVYPVRDINSNLINIKGRTLYNNYKELGIAKYINYYPVGVMDYFQCLNKTYPFIKEKNEIIVFESIKSVMKAYGWGYCNCVSAEKHSLTKQQIDLLINLKVNIVFAYDSDINFYRDCSKDIQTLKRVANIFVITEQGGVLGGEKSKNSPVDCGLEIWKQLYSNKRKVV